MVYEGICGVARLAGYELPHTDTYKSLPMCVCQKGNIAHSVTHSVLGQMCSVPLEKLKKNNNLTVQRD